MELERYTDRAKGFLQSAQELALRSGHQRLAPEHLLKVLLDDPEGLAANLIQAAGGNPKRALAGVEAELAKLPKVEGAGAGQVYLSPEVARLFDHAEQLAVKAGDAFVTVERLLLALTLAKGTAAARLLSEAGVTPQALNAAVEALPKGRTADTASAEEGYDALKKYARDLTAAAREGKLDPVIGRDEEIRRTIQVLSRRTKHRATRRSKRRSTRPSDLAGARSREERGSRCEWREADTDEPASTARRARRADRAERRG